MSWYKKENFDQILAVLLFKDLEVSKLRLGILKTSKHGHETSNFKDLMLVRFSATIFVSRQRSTGEVSYYSFVQTDLSKFETMTRLSRILHGFYSFEDDESVFTNLWIHPALITFPISNTGGGKPKGNSSAAGTSRVQGMQGGSPS